MKIRAEEIEFRYPSGVNALLGIDLEIQEAEAVAIVGANGAGKTTLVKHFNGLLRPTEGTVYVGDWDTRSRTVAELSTRIAFAFQNPEDQIFKSKVYDEVAFGPRNLGLSETEIQQRVDGALEMLGLLDTEDEHPYDLNPADRKLLTLASAVAMDTPIIIFDEPTTGQDATGLARITRMLQDLKQNNHTVIVISHDLDFCAENLETVMVMGGGRIIRHGDIAEVFSDQKLLNESGLDPPQLVRLASGVGMQSSPMNESDFLHAYALRSTKT